MLISLEHIRKYHNETCILQDVSFAMEERRKCALIGVNGTGKSTLLAILAGVEPYDQGKIIRKKECRIAYLAQDPQLDENKTILAEVLQGDTKEYEAKAMLGKLGLYSYDEAISHLSGGQRKRVALAKVLMKESDLLLLDEPTNHLDADMIEWLEGYLIKSNQALFMVTHDRYFMERITDQIAELDQGALYFYQGNYVTYMEEKQRRLEESERKERKRQSLLKKELAWVRAGVQARGTKDKGRLERFEQLRQAEGIHSEDPIKVSTLSSRLGKKTIALDHISKAYGDRVLFRDFSYQIQRHERIGILGSNGCGKSTLLHVIHGDLSADSGTLTYGETVKLGYFAQSNEALDPDQRLIDVIREISDDIETKEGHLSAAQMLEQFLFDRHKQYQKVSTLSGGEKRRLYLLSVLMAAPNILLLDEPTNDLDITTLQILEDYLEDFPGAVIVVSHDRYFLDRICDSMWIFQPNAGIQTTIGGYSQYRHEAASIGASAQCSDQRKTPKAQQTRRMIPSMSSKEKKEWESMETVIAELEEGIAACDAQMAQNMDDFKRIQELSEQRALLEAELERKTERWMELEEIHDRIERAKRK